MDALLSPEAALASLFAAAFAAATLIPFSSEAALVAVLAAHGGWFWSALGVATLGNTAGGLTSYLIGRYFGARRPLTQLERVRRWGAPALAFAWLPLVGDALCVAAGWLKLGWMQAALYQAAGRFARYWVIAQGAAAW